MAEAQLYDSKGDFMTEQDRGRARSAKGGQVLDRRTEILLALVLLGLPLLYLATEHSWVPVYWHYSRTLLLAILGYGVFYGLFLLTYRWSVPPFFARTRSLGVLFGFWIFAALLGTEGLLALIDDRPNVEVIRLRGYAPDPDTGYVYIPNFEQQMKHLEGSVLWRTNAQGVRANQNYGPKLEGVTRILAVGDSFTVAARLPLEEAWPGVLEQRLNREAEDGTRFEVVNAGHAGYGTLQQLAWLRKFGDRFSADMAVLALTPNDITDHKAEPPAPFKAVDGYLAQRNSDQAQKRVWEHHQRWYSLTGYIRRSHIWRQVQTIRVQLAGESRLPKLAACRVDFGEEERRLHDMTERSILGIRDWVGRRGGRFAIVLLTFRQQLGEMAPGYDPEKFTRYWTRFAQEHGIPAISTFDVFRNHPKPETLYWRWDHHYNANGSRLTGELAADLVKREWF